MQRWDGVSGLSYISLNVIVCNTLQEHKINTFFFASQFHIITMHHLDINLIRWYLTSNGGSEDSIYW